MLFRIWVAVVAVYFLKTDAAWLDVSGFALAVQNTHSDSTALSFRYLQKQQQQQ